MRTRPGVSRLSLAATLSLLVLLIAAPSALGVEETITSDGPLNEIIISDLLNCQVAHVDDERFEFFPSGDRVGACGTFLYVQATDTLYGPESVPAGSSAAGNPPFTADSQTAVTGSGTDADPYQIVTVVTLADSGLTITETDSYVVGVEHYQTDIDLSLAGSATGPIAAVLYRAGDCYLQNSDFGFGNFDSRTSAIRCVAAEDPEAATPAPGRRIEEWVPLTTGSSYFQAAYSEVWTWIATGEPFPNTCECDEYQDNGAGLSWDVNVPVGGSVTVSHLTTFSPEGRGALVSPPPATPTAAPTVAATLVPSGAMDASSLRGQTGILVSALILFASLGTLVVARPRR